MREKIEYFAKITFGCIVTFIIWVAMLGMHEVEGTDMEGTHILTIPSIMDIIRGE